MLDDKVITQTVRNQVFDGVAGFVYAFTPSDGVDLTDEQQSDAYLNLSI
jgi:hypothetical protein